MKLRLLIYALVVAALIGFAVWAMKPRDLGVEIFEVQRGVFREVVQSEGRIRSRTRELVTAFGTGTISRMDLKVGDEVKKGQKLGTLFWDYDRLILAPVGGVVSKIHRSSAGPVTRGEPLIEIVRIDQLEVAMELLTSDVVRVKTGDPVRVTGWGGEPPLEATVVRVSRAGFLKTSALGVEEERAEVVADLKGVPKDVLERLGDYFRVECQIVVGEQPDSVIVPVGALFREGPHWAVFKVVDGRARKTTIEISHRNLGEVRITSGLIPGDQVILYPGGVVKEGIRVTGR